MTLTASKLAHRITIERATQTTDRYGAIVETWTPFASVRAEIVEERRQRENDDKSEIDASNVVLRIRSLPGLSLSDRLTMAGQTFAIVSFVPTEDRRGIEITCEARA
ncbi:phage head closure protein [Aureimonas sp. D3]|uniref:phage head closure protein n=1 Tax=Aureimonas sp. D3 TaxID=1638164 RepID=UPI0007844377|nr:phage head closure protein [Aureimonas sp. D3]